MKKNSGFPQFIERILQAKDQVVVGEQVQTGPIAVLPAIGQGIPIEVQCIPHISGIKKEIEVEGKGDRIELVERNKSCLDHFLRHQFKLDVVPGEEVPLPVDDIVLITPYRLASVAQSAGIDKRLAVGPRKFRG